jgi:hypothetical protein
MKSSIGLPTPLSDLRRRPVEHPKIAVPRATVGSDDLRTVHVWNQDLRQNLTSEFSRRLPTLCPTAKTEDPKTYLVGLYDEGGGFEGVRRAMC